MPDPDQPPSHAIELDHALLELCGDAPLIYWARAVEFMLWDPFRRSSPTLERLNARRAELTLARLRRGRPPLHADDAIASEEIDRLIDYLTPDTQHGLFWAAGTGRFR